MEINNSSVAVTIDIDWACESAIEYTLDYFANMKIPVTVFTTHDSKVIRERLDNLEVGLHPYFHLDSMHGATIEETIESVLKLPHNIKSFRCHRFITSNEIQKGMKDAGMISSSNICTNLETINPFYNRYNILEFPIFWEDGGFLYNGHDLTISQKFVKKISSNGLKTIVIHPMHFALNTPDWDFMVKIKCNTNRTEWNSMSGDTLKKLKNRNRGIFNFLEDIFNQIKRSCDMFCTIGDMTTLINNTNNGQIGINSSLKIS